MTESSLMPAAVSVLIVNFNSTDVLIECLEALADSTIADQLEVIVVDNASLDFDANTLSSRFPWVIWLPQSTNTTFTGGNNLAYERATSDLILMLNPDTRVEPQALERAVRHMRDSQDLSALGAYLIGPDGELQRYYRRIPTLRDLPAILFEPLFRNTARGRRYLMADEPLDGPTPVEDPPGAFLMVRKQNLGNWLLEPGYFNFVSDLELCERMNRCGLVVVFPDVRCHHQRAGAGIGTRDPRLRLRLYHDLTWGLRRFFRDRAMLTSLTLNALLVPYWVVRLAMIGVRHPTAIPAGLGHATAALAGRPPRY